MPLSLSTEDQSTKVPILEEEIKSIGKENKSEKK